MSHPNILYIHSHDTGRYIQPYGHAVPAPNLQQLAEEGILFRKAFCAAPTCSPSRAALLTGQAAHSSGMTGLVHRGAGFRLHDYEQHLVHTLQAAGYSSALIGQQHVASDPAMIGYDQVIDVASNDAKDVTPAALAFLRNAPESPFFLTVGFSEVHREFPEPGPTEDPRYCLPPAPLPDTPRTRADMAAFKAGARIYDDAVGQVLATLAEMGLADNTLVICTTDHGVAFPGLKCNLTDHGTGVLLIMRGPGGFSGGQVIDGMVSHIDVFPTICEVLGVTPPVWLQGQSMMPLVRGEADEINEAVFSEVSYHAAYEPKRAIRTQRYKYIRHYGDFDKPVLPNCDDSLSKEVWLENGWRERPIPRERLYDLIFDPNETQNLASNPAYESVLTNLQNRLDAWMVRTGDPLLAGPVPAAAGTQVNDQAGLSPSEPTLTIDG